MNAAQVTGELFRQACEAGERAALSFRLPLLHRKWRGMAGRWAGTAAGSSVDFHDHRAYLPGDDPRYINWQAYARTGLYSMKQFREEVSPSVDLVLDASASMFFHPAKARRALELFAFGAACARVSGAVLRPWLVNAAGVRSVEPEHWDQGILPWPEEHEGPPALELVPWRTASLRLLISDFLFAEGPAALFARLSEHSGRGLVLRPFCREEADPQWTGSMEFVDCEDGRVKVLSVTAPMLARYREAFHNHQSRVREEAAHHGVVVAGIQAEAALEDALLDGALHDGVVEPCH